MTKERTTFVVTYCASDSAIFLLDFESVLMPNGEIIVFVFQYYPNSEVDTFLHWDILS